MGRKATQPATKLAAHQQCLTYDPMSPVLEKYHLRCFLPGISNLTAPWGVKYGKPDPKEIREMREKYGDVLPPPPSRKRIVHGAIFVVQRGSCWLQMPEENVSIQLVAGDALLIARPGPHILRDQPKSPIKPLHHYLSAEQMMERQGLSGGGGGH